MVSGARGALRDTDYGRQDEKGIGPEFINGD
jgi:hypothetical protein